MPIDESSRAAPATLRNPVLLGTLLLPLGLMPRPERRHVEPAEPEPEEVDGNAPSMPRSAKSKFRRPPKEPILKIGMLPIARGDTERLRQILSLQSRIADLEMSPRAKRSLMHRGPFEDSLTWFEIHGNAPAVLEHWKGFIEALGDEAKHPPGGRSRADRRRGRSAAAPTTRPSPSRAQRIQDDRQKADRLIPDPDRLIPEP